MFSAISSMVAQIFHMRNSRPSEKVTEIAKAFPATCRIPEVGVSIVKSFDNIREEMMNISSKVSNIMTDHSNELELHYQEKRAEAEAQLRALRLQVLDSEKRAAADPTVKALSVEVDWYTREMDRIEVESSSFKRDILEYKDCQANWERDRPLLEEKIMNMKWQIRVARSEQVEPNRVPELIPYTEPPLPGDAHAKKRIQYILELDEVEREIRKTRSEIYALQKDCDGNGLVQSVIVKSALRQVLNQLSVDHQAAVANWMEVWTKSM